MITDPIIVAKVALLNAQIDSLETAIGSGFTRLSYNGQSTEYASIQDMKQALNFAKSTLAGLIQPGYRKPQAGVAHFVNPYRTRQRMTD